MTRSVRRHHQGEEAKVLEEAALISQANDLESLGEQQDAHQLWEKAARIEESVAALVGLGRSHLILGNHTSARNILRRAIEKSEESAEAHWYLGFTLESMDDLIGAREALERGLSLREWAPARVILAEVYRRLGEPSLSVSEFRRAIDADPSNPDAWFGLGLARQDTDPAEALRSFEKALDVAPEFGPARRERGWLLAQRGQRESAVNDLSQATKLMPQDAKSHAYLGIVYALLGKADEAVAEAGIAVELAPEVVLFRCNLGDTLASLGRQTEAERQYRTALSLDVSNQHANLRYGQFLERCGRPGRALVYLRRAIVADPTDQRALRLLEKIESSAQDHGH